MKRFLFAAVAAAGVCTSAPLFAGDIGVSISIGEPGFYGRLDLGNVPAPQLIYAQPVVVERPPVAVVREPIYLHVPPGYEKHWSRHCREYGACGHPVYFVREQWYNQIYVPHYREAHRVRAQERHDEDHGHGHGKDHDKDHGHDRHDD